MRHVTTSPPRRQMAREQWPPNRRRDVDSLDEDQDEATKAALVELRKQGLRLPSRPAGEMPEIPDRVGDLPDDDLMDLYGQTVAWQKYADGRLALAEIREKSADAALDKARASAIVNAKAKTATETKAKAADDPEVAKANQRQLNAYAITKATGVVARAAENDMRFLSRELSRRIGTADQDRRNNRWNA